MSASELFEPRIHLLKSGSHWLDNFLISLASLDANSQKFSVGLAEDGFVANIEGSIMEDLGLQLELLQLTGKKLLVELVTTLQQTETFGHDVETFTEKFKLLCERSSEPNIVEPAVHCQQPEVCLQVAVGGHSSDKNSRPADNEPDIPVAEIAAEKVPPVVDSQTRRGRKSHRKSSTRARKAEVLPSTVQSNPDSTSITPDLPQTNDRPVIKTKRAEPTRALHCCSQCDKTFAVRSDLTKHMRRHTGERPFHCRQCTRTFSCSSNLHVHIRRSHTAPDNQNLPHACGKCEARFPYASLLRTHERQHEVSSARTLQCTKCDKLFHGKRVLHVHMSSAHGIEFKKRKTAAATEKKDPSTDSVVTNVDVHKPHLCSECGARFALPCQLRSHFRKHVADDRPFACSQCPRRYIYASQLAIHERTHTGIKPFMCPECGDRFGHVGALRRHARSHEGARPVVCPMCGRRFAQGTHMRRHMLTHTGDQPHVCSVCRRGFTQLASLKRHMKSLHANSGDFMRTNLAAAERC